MESTEYLNRKGHDRLHLFFGLSRASWITIPRILAQEMPDDWQNRMADLMDEYEQTWTNWPEGIGTRVQITDHGRLTTLHNWILNYRYPDRNKIRSLRNTLTIIPRP